MLHGLSLVAMSRGYPLVAMCGLLIAMASLVGGAGAPGHMGSGDVTPRLLSTGSVAVVHRLSCSEACGIFLDQGSNPCRPHWQVDS